MLRTNKDKLIMLSLMAQVDHPRSSDGYNHDKEGNSFRTPSSGGITYNYRLGSPTYGIAGDHVEPGASLKNPDSRENTAVMTYAKIGNEAIVAEGDAKGARGVVIGSHAGVDHTMVQFDDETNDKLLPGDKVLIRGIGSGLELCDYPEIKVLNVDPQVLERIDIEERNGVIYFPVAAVIPAHIMGAGIGAFTSFMGDYDIMTQDDDANEKYGLRNLRIGDFVLLEDCDNSYGRGYKKGAVSLGMIIHSDCIAPGHGPGVTVMMTCKRRLIEGMLSAKCNLADYL